MIKSDYVKGEIVGFVFGVTVCMAVFLIWGSVSSPFFVVKNQQVSDVSSTNSVDTRVTLLEHQVKSINERLSDTNINAMREQVMLQTGDINALRNRVYKIEFEWGK